MWSTGSRYVPVPQDEILVFLPNGIGVLEVYNWALCWYETFTYTVHKDVLTMTGDTRYSDNLKTYQIEQEPSRIHYDGKFLIHIGKDIDGAPLEIIDFGYPPVEFATREKTFGRVVLDIASYRYPSFEEWRK